jgi:acetyl-CoA carboxylase alpha subunit
MESLLSISFILDSISEFNTMSEEERLSKRYEKLMSLGRFEEKK